MEGVISSGLLWEARDKETRGEGVVSFCDSVDMFSFCPPDGAAAFLAAWCFLHPVLFFSKLYQLSTFS